MGVTMKQFELIKITNKKETPRYRIVDRHNKTSTHTSSNIRAVFSLPLYKTSSHRYNEAVARHLVGKPVKSYKVLSSSDSIHGFRDTHPELFI